MKKSVRQLKSQAGFSLIELMIVVAIIGILASIAVPNFQKFQRRAKQSEGKGYLAGIYSAEQGFKAEWNSFTTDLQCIGFKDTSPQLLASNPGSDGLAGRGQYRAGFLTAGGVTGAASGTTCINTANMTATPAPAAGAAPPAAVIASTADAISFIAASTGTLNGALEDQWNINEGKVVNNVQSGL